MNNDEYWMKIAIEEANLAMAENEIPVGAVIVLNDKLIAQAHNQPIIKNDPTAHAEIQALRKAADHQKNYRLVESTLYVTLEPCVMCFGAMIHARIHRLVYSAPDLKTGACGSCINLNKEGFFNHKISVRSGVLEKDSSELLKLFFRARR
jgi:tRNA(adenine34) deaminase